MLPEEEDPSFQLADYLVLGFMFLVSLIIGLYYAIVSRKTRSAKEYFTAGGNIGIVPASLSLIASILCSIWYVAVPVEVYTYGIHFAIDIPVLVIALLISGYAYLPVFYELQVTSTTEYLEKRFGKLIRRLGSFLYLVNTTLYVSLVMYIPALSISQVMNINLWISVSTVCIVGTVYTALGGIRAVMWTDVFQSVIIYSSLIAIAIKGTIDVGGIGFVWNKGVEGHRIAAAPLSVDPRYRYNILWLTLTEVCYYLGFYGVYQTQIQRYVSCPSIKHAQRALWMNIPGLIFVLFLIVYIGVLLYANFHKCDPLSDGKISEATELLVYFVMKLFNTMPGMSGLFVAGIFSGALSTVSSCLNSMAAVTAEDFLILVPKFKNMKDERKTFISKWIASFYGLVMMALIILLERVDNIVTFWGYNNSLVFGINLAIYTLGLFCPWVDTFSVLSGFIASAAFGIFLSVGGQISATQFQTLPLGNCSWNEDSFTNINNAYSMNNFTTDHSHIPFLYAHDLTNNGGVFELFKISPIYVQCIAFFIALIVGMVSGGIFGNNNIECADVKLFSPVIRNWVRKSWIKPNEMFEINGKEMEDDCLIMETDIKNSTWKVIPYATKGIQI